METAHVYKTWTVMATVSALQYRVLKNRSPAGADPDQERFEDDNFFIEGKPFSI
jgi:hypothetical protein